MARAIYKGRVILDDQEVPVKFYSAIEPSGVHFRLLHAEDGEPVTQELYDTESDETVDKSDVHKAFEVEPHVFVKLTADELEQIEPEPSRSIELLRFVKPECIDHRWYQRPYYLGPDGDERAYFAFAKALADSGLEGIARWVMRKRSYVGALREHAGRLLLVSLRHSEEVVGLDAFPDPSIKTLSRKEIELARQLMATLEGPFDSDELQDDYRERVEALVAQKLEGKVIQLPKRRKSASSGSSLADALKDSLRPANKRKSA